MPAVPEKIGNFPVHKLLGKGGMALVYQVLDPSTGKLLALKVISEDLRDELDRLRFEREFRLATRFTHPNLIKVFEMGYYQGRPYYTMELIEGLNIRDYLQEQARVRGWEEWVLCLGAVGAQLLAGLEYIHSKQVLHRDLKPENLIVDSRGKLCFLDFGLARDTMADTKFTQTGMIVGTPAYMAPEQFGAALADARTDLFAVGVILYEILSGRQPHPGSDLRTMLFHLMTEPAEPLICHGPVPPGLEALVVRLLASEPADRPSGCQQALTEWLEVFPQLTVERSTSHRELYLPTYQGQEPLLAAADQLLARRRGLLLARGSGGAGKSRWLEEVGRLGVRADWEVAHASCGAWRGTPYGPWIEILRSALPTDLPSNLEAQRSTLAILLPELGEPAMLGEAGKLRLFRSVYQALSRRNPGLLILLDDIQELDHVSQELLAYLLLAELPGLVMVATVAAEAPPSRWSARDLDNLTPAQAVTMAESILGGRLDAVSSQALWSSSQGNPLLLAEILHGAFVGGDFFVRHDSYQLANPSQLPGTLSQALERRLQLLSPNEKDLLIWLAGWQGRADFDAITVFFAELPRHLLVDDLEALVRHQLVVREGKGYFLLPQVARVVRESLPASRRRQLHEHIAARLQVLPDPPQERIGLHWLEAERPELATAPLMAAAARQARLFNYGRAVEIYELIQGLPEPLPESLRELKAEALMGALRVEDALKLYLELHSQAPSLSLQIKMAQCHWRLGNLQETQHLLGQTGLPSSSRWSRWVLSVDCVKLRLGVSWAQRASDPGQRVARRILRRTLMWLRPPGWQLDRLALTLSDLGESPQEAMIRRHMLRGVGLMFGPSPSLKGARSHLLKAGELALRLEQGELLGEIGSYALLAGCSQGLELLKAGWTCCEQRGEMRPMLDCAAALMLIHRLAGRLGQAQRWAGELLQLIRHAQDRLELARYHIHQSLLYCVGGQTALADEQLKQAVDHQGIELLSCERHLAQGYVALFQGDRAACLEFAKRSLADDLFHSLESNLLGAYAGQPSLASILRHSRDTYPIFQTCALRLSGKLEQALQLARQWDFPLEEGLCLAALSRRRNQPELLHPSREALERSQLESTVIEQILLKPGSYPLSGHSAAH